MPRDTPMARKSLYAPPPERESLGGVVQEEGAEEMYVRDMDGAVDVSMATDTGPAVGGAAGKKGKGKGKGKGKQKEEKSKDIERERESRVEDEDEGLSIEV